MNDELRRIVRRRARYRCEFCGLPEADSPSVPHHVEHIVALKHHGPTRSSNLCLSCHRCNFNKGTDLSGLDPPSGKLTKLFNPRRQKWDRHFRWAGFLLVGKTAIGRATVDVLRVNESERVRLRETLAALGRFPW
jgi:hypothetical protein